MDTENNMGTKAEELALENSRRIGKLLCARKETIAVAESVTSGQLQTFLSLPDRAMDFFQGGLTAYNLGQKTKHLDVDPIHAFACNCVSERVASEMANNIRLMFNSDWGIGITGYASPVPEKNIEELFACFSIAGRKGGNISGVIHAPEDTQLGVSRYYTQAVLEKFLIHLQEQG